MTSINHISAISATSATHLNLKLTTSETIFTNNFNKIYEKFNIKKAKYHGKFIQNIRNNVPEALQLDISANFDKLAKIESDINSLITPKNNLEKEAYNELLFTQKSLSCINFIPYFLALWSIFRIWIIPGISFLIPVFTIILPFFIVKFVFNTNINMNNYMGILSQLTKKAGMSIANSSLSSNISFSLPSLLTVGMTLIQGFIQPYWSWKHLCSINEIVENKEDILDTFRSLYIDIYTKLQGVGIKITRCLIPDKYDKKQALAFILNNPKYLEMMLYKLASFEILFRLAVHRHVCIVTWGCRGLLLKQAYDYNISEQKRVPIDITLDQTGGHHVILTGPNKGGKSTVLRAINYSVQLAHIYGCSFAEYAEMTPLYRLYTCLSADDLPGKKSRFEREIDFAHETLRRPGSSSAPSLILIDELFHSTNPPDAKTVSEYYTGILWKTPATMSIISTHIFELAEKSPVSVQKLCCPGELQGDPLAGKQRIHYRYGLEKGINKVSSVFELWGGTLASPGLSEGHTHQPSGLNRPEGVY